MKWKRVTPGHLELMVEHIADSPEVAAEIKKERSKWRVILWSWGSDNPQPVTTNKDWLRYPSAKHAKQAAEAAVLEDL